jgi:hypothetical protein
LASVNEEKCEVIYDRNAYGSEYIDTPKGKNWMSKTMSETFIHPVINNINNKNGVVLYYSNTNQRGHFNVPKVIISSSSAQMNYIDSIGEYGMSKNIFGIKIDDLNEGELIVKALNSKRFKTLCKGLNYSSFGVEWEFFQLLKKDFYNQFVDENGNEI